MIYVYIATIWLPLPRNGMEWLLSVIPNGHLVCTISKRNETVICMGQRNGTVAIKQALKQRHFLQCYRNLVRQANFKRSGSTSIPTGAVLLPHTCCSRPFLASQLPVFLSKGKEPGLLSLYSSMFSLSFSQCMVQ